MPTIDLHGPVHPDVAASILRLLADGKVTVDEAGKLLDGASLGGDDPDLYECDGCGLVGTMAKVDGHVGKTCRWPDGTLKDPADTVCFGGMLVGGRAWVAYHTEGRHPMSYIVGEVRKLVEGGE